MRRAGVILLLIFQTVFLNIVVPGHLRGVITLSGKSSVRGVKDLVCGGCCQKDAAKKQEGKPSSKDRKDCAICYVAATLSTPAGLIWYLPEQGRVDLVSDPVPQIVETHAFVHTYDACGPPTLTA